VNCSYTVGFLSKGVVRTFYRIYTTPCLFSIGVLSVFYFSKLTVVHPFSAGNNLVTSKGVIVREFGLNFTALRVEI
jgi:hypothetical protein